MEREGAEWRGIFLATVLAIVALVGLPKLSDLLEFQNHVYLITTFANPLLVAFALFFVLVLWSIVAELWLSELPNQVIALACVQAKHTLEKTGSSIKRFETFEVVTLKNPDSLEEEDRVRWNLIAKQPLPDGRWRCLVEARTWLVGHGQQQ